MWSDIQHIIKYMKLLLFMLFTILALSSFRPKSSFIMLWLFFIPFIKSLLDLLGKIQKHCALLIQEYLNNTAMSSTLYEYVFHRGMVI